MNRQLLIIILLMIFQFPGLKAVDFSAKEKSIIYTNAIKLLENYQTILNQVGESVVTDIEKAKSGSESFLELFVNRQVLLFNDLDPSHKLSEFYEAETYASNVMLWYPDGITINMNFANARVSEIIQHEETVYSIDLMVTKNINGNYMNETLNKNSEELTFRIAFGLENNDLTNFRIVGIRNASSNVVVDYSKALKEVNSEDLNVEDLNKIYSEIKTVLQDYTNFLSLLGDPQEAAEDKEFYKTSFQNLFQNQETKLFNDIMPEPPSKLISVQDYLSSYLADFPNGIKNLKINTDSAKFGKVMKAEDESYYTYVDANKFFSGSYKGKDAFRQMFPLIFKLSFNESGKTFTNFRINSVDISSVDFYQDTKEGVLEKKPSIIISPVTRKGWSVSVAGSLGMSGIKNGNIESLTLAKDLYSWDVSTIAGYLGAVGFTYYSSEHFAVRTGLEFNKIASKFSLNGTITDDSLSTDINNVKYNRIITADFDSLVTINYLTIPILINYTSGKPGKKGFYAESGMKVSIPLNASYSSKGNYKFTGYYPSLSDFREAPEFGFYTRENIDESDKIRMKNLVFSFHASAGISLPLGYYSSVQIGPEMTIGMSDISKDEKKNYTDIFGKLHEHQSVKINYFGLRISFAYKL